MAEIIKKDTYDKKAFWDLGVMMNRNNPLPIDKSSIFFSKTDADTYAKENAVAYVGQTVAVVETDAEGKASDVRLYIIDKDSTLKEVGSASISIVNGYYDEAGTYGTKGTFYADGSYTEKMIEDNVPVKSYTRTTDESTGAYVYTEIKIDLSNYVKKDTTIAGIDLQDNITTDELTAALNQVTGGTEGKQGLMSSTDKDKLDGIEEGAQVNKIESITGDTSNSYVKIDFSEPDTNKQVSTTLTVKTADFDDSDDNGLAIVGDVKDYVDSKIPEVPVLGVKDGEKIISLDDNKLLSSTLSIAIEKKTIGTAEKECIVLKGIDDTEVAYVDASQFVVDGMIESVEWSKEAGKENVLVITFNTDAGKKAIEVDFSKFANLYTAKEAIKINDHVISLALDNSDDEEEDILTVELSQSDNGLHAVVDVKALNDAIKAAQELAESNYDVLYGSDDNGLIYRVEELEKAKSHTTVIGDTASYSVVETGSTGTERVVKNTLATVQPALTEASATDTLTWTAGLVTDSLLRDYIDYKLSWEDLSTSTGE